MFEAGGPGKHDIGIPTVTQGSVEFELGIPRRSISERGLENGNSHLNPTPLMHRPTGLSASLNLGMIKFD